MKTKILYTLLSLCTVTAAFGKSVDEKHFLLSGRVIEVDMIASTEKPAVNAQIVVYQDNDVYVAFYTQKSGMYEFNLPVGHRYEIWYGGSAYVNKRVVIDATVCPERKSGNDLKMDIGLFRPIEGYEFEPLTEPFVMVSFDRDSKKLVPDMKYAEQKRKELNKVFKHILREKDASYCEEAYYK